MVHKVKPKGNVVEWGLDLTQVKSDDAFLKLLGKFGFKKVYSEKPSDVAYTDQEGKSVTREYFDKGRWNEYMVTFENPSKIRITVEHMGGKGGDKGFLGYIGMKAPKSAEAELKRFLVGFRGSKPMPMDVYQKFKPKGIATYVKEENPYENPYITVK